MKGYTIKALDKEGCVLRVHDDWIMSKLEAIKDGKEMLRDPELSAELDTVQVIDKNGDCIWDDFPA